MNPQSNAFLLDHSSNCSEDAVDSGFLHRITHLFSNSAENEELYSLAPIIYLNSNKKTDSIIYNRLQSSTIPTLPSLGLAHSFISSSVCYFLYCSKLNIQFWLFYFLMVFFRLIYYLSNDILMSKRLNLRFPLPIRFNEFHRFYFHIHRIHLKVSPFLHLSCTSIYILILLSFLVQSCSNHVRSKPGSRSGCNIFLWVDPISRRLCLLFRSIFFWKKRATGTESTGETPAACLSMSSRQFRIWKIRWWDTCMKLLRWHRWWVWLLRMGQL